MGRRAVPPLHWPPGWDLWGLAVTSQAAFALLPTAVAFSGHKSTLDVVSLRGQAPGGVLADPGFSTLLAVAGPLARTAQDLEAALEVLGGPEMPDSIAYTWRLPKARHEQLREFRIGYVLNDPLMPVSSEIMPALESAVRALEKGGAKLRPGWPSRFLLPRTVLHLPRDADRVQLQHCAIRGSNPATGGICQPRKKVSVQAPLSSSSRVGIATTCADLHFARRGKSIFETWTHSFCQRCRWRRSRTTIRTKRRGS